MNKIIQQGRECPPGLTGVLNDFVDEINILRAAIENYGECIDDLRANQNILFDERKKKILEILTGVKKC